MLYKEEKVKRLLKLSKPEPNNSPPRARAQVQGKPKRSWVKKSKYQRNQKKLKKSKISMVYNYSSLTLTPSMEALFNKGLNYAVTPEKLDITQVLVDHKYFERTLVWIDLFFDKEPDEERKPGIFRKKKHNFPKNYRSPDALQTFISATRAEIQDPENRNKNVRPNLPKDLMLALKELIKLQRKRIITIQKCDKGSGVIILDCDEYIRSCNEHLTKTLKNTDGSETPYYREVDSRNLDAAKTEILDVLKEAHKEGIISDDEFEAMDPSSKKVARFYQIFKVHKPHVEGKAPPERPIISGSGSITENCSLFVTHHIKSLSTQHPTYVQDTPDFLRAIDPEILNDISDDAILASIDVTGLYTNIRHEDAIKAVRDALDKRTEQEKKAVPTKFIVKLLELVLKWNLFEFDRKMFIQVIGFAMGTRCAPNVADLVMAVLDEQILECAKLPDGSSMIKLLRRFLDDLFFIWTGSVSDLHSFLVRINQLHPTIKFTLTHTKRASDDSDICGCPVSENIAFLDTSRNAKIAKK